MIYNENRYWHLSRQILSGGEQRPDLNILTYSVLGETTFDAPRGKKLWFLSKSLIVDHSGCFEVVFFSPRIKP